VIRSVGDPPAAVYLVNRCPIIVGKKTEFYLHENTRVTGEFRGCDVETSEFFVKNLETPMGRIPEAILRNSDVIYLDSGDIDIAQ